MNKNIKKLVCMCFLCNSCGIDPFPMESYGPYASPLVYDSVPPPALSINEFLFDPVGNACDFVELVNTSSDSLNLSRYSLANRNTKGEIASKKPLSKQTVILPPGGYVLLCADVNQLFRYYQPPADSLCLALGSLPSMPNDKGCVVLIDDQGRVVDEVAYTKNMHHPLLPDKEGVSLEKIHPNLPSSSALSWASASSLSGGSTPGLRNSHYRQVFLQTTYPDEFTLDSSVVFPSRLGAESVILLRYRCSSIYMASLSLYDEAGLFRMILAEQQLLGAEGYFRIQAEDAQGKPLPKGRYYLRLDYINLDGSTQRKLFPFGVM